MSASREKKQRQNAGPGSRESQARPEEQAYRRKVITYTTIGVVVVILVALLLIWNTGVFDKGKTAATVGDAKYSITDVSYYYQESRSQNFSLYYMYGMTPPADSDVLDEESGKTYRDNYLEQALASMTQMTALYDEAVKNGVTEQDVADKVEKDIQEHKDAASQSGYGYGAYLKAAYGKYMSDGALRSILTKKYMAQACRDNYTNSLTYTDDEIQAYYDEHTDTLDTYEYSYLYFTPEEVESTGEDGEELSEEDKEALEAEALSAAKADADAALAALQAGDDVAKVIEEHEPAASGDHTTAVGSDVPSSYNVTLYAMKAGEADLAENGEEGYYVLALHNRTRSEDITRDTRHILIRAEATTNEDGTSTAPSDEAWAKAKETAEKVLAEYQAGEQTAEAFGALAEEYSEDSGSNANGGLYEGVEQGGFVTEYDSWLFDSARKAGDVDIIRHDSDTNYYGYHIVYYVGENDPTWKLTSVNALRSADVTEWLDGLKANYTGALVDDGAKLVGQ